MCIKPSSASGTEMIFSPFTSLSITPLDTVYPSRPSNRLNKDALSRTRMCFGRTTVLKISSEKPTGNPGVPGASYVKTPNVTNGIKPAFVEYSLDVMDEDKATAAIEVFNNAIITVASERSKLGAIQNRLEKTIANLDNTAENLTAAKSRIEDTDMALEMSEFTKFNILQQAGTAMLSQANQQPQMMLKLLNA